ncbi:MAG: hypothetical protein ACPG5B_11620 [Chitinophagales bacterium]
MKSILSNNILLFIAIIFTACEQENILLEQKIMSEIIEEHFNDLPIRAELLPIGDYKTWVKGKYTIGTDHDGNKYKIPLLPPMDSIFYSKRYFEKPISKNVLTAKDTCYMMEKLRKYENKIGEILVDSQNRFLSKEEKLCNQSCMEMIGFMPDYVSHYQFSQPLFNEDKTKVLLTVYCNYFRGGSGHRYFFQQANNVWNLCYIELEWIS